MFKTQLLTKVAEEFTTLKEVIQDVIPEEEELVYTQLATCRANIETQINTINVKSTIKSAVNESDGSFESKEAKNPPYEMPTSFKTPDQDFRGGRQHLDYGTSEQNSQEKSGGYWSQIEKVVQVTSQCIKQMELLHQHRCEQYAKEKHVLEDLAAKNLATLNLCNNHLRFFNFTAFLMFLFIAVNLINTMI